MTGTGANLRHVDHYDANIVRAKERFERKSHAERTSPIALFGAFCRRINFANPGVEPEDLKTTGYCDANGISSHPPLDIRNRPTRSCQQLRVIKAALNVQSARLCIAVAEDSCSRWLSEKDVPTATLDPRLCYLDQPGYDMKYDMNCSRDTA